MDARNRRKARDGRVYSCDEGSKHENPVPGVVLAGDYTDPDYPPTLEAAVRSGVRAAGLALEQP